MVILVLLCLGMLDRKGGRLALLLQISLKNFFGNRLLRRADGRFMEYFLLVVFAFNLLFCFVSENYIMSE